MGNCLDSGDANAGADGKAAAGMAGVLAAGATTFEGKNDGGRVNLAINGADKTFVLNEYTGDSTDVTTAWTGAITDADGVFTLDASAEGATTSDVKTFVVTLSEAGAITLAHKFVGDVEELTRQGEAAAAEAAPADGEAAAAE